MAEWLGESMTERFGEWVAERFGEWVAERFGEWVAERLGEWVAEGVQGLGSKGGKEPAKARVALAGRVTQGGVPLSV